MIEMHIQVVIITEITVQGQLLDIFIEMCRRTLWFFFFFSNLRVTLIIVSTFFFSICCIRLISTQGTMTCNAVSRGLIMC